MATNFVVDLVPITTWNPTAAADETLLEGEAEIKTVTIEGATGPQSGTTTQGTDISDNIVTLKVTCADEADSTTTLSQAATTIAEGAEYSATDTTLTVTSGAAFAQSVPFFIKIENEILKVTAVATNDLTVVRGDKGTTAATHADTTAVTEYYDEDSTTMDVASGAALVDEAYYRLGVSGTEVVQVKSISTNEITVERMKEGSTAAQAPGVTNTALYRTYGVDDVDGVLVTESLNDNFQRRGPGTYVTA